MRFGLYAVAGVLLLATAPAHANHVPGATYRGTTATGGTVEFDVSADGRAVTRFVAADVPGSCGGTISKSFTGSLPIVNHAFASDPADSIRFQGSFPASAQATGSLLQADCAGAPLSWSAATGAPAATPQAQPDTTAPALSVRARRSQRLGPGGRIRVRVSCPSEPCRVVAGGSVSAQGMGSFRLRGATSQLAQGGSVRLEPRPVRRALRAVRRALRDGRRVTARVTVSAVDVAGNRTVRRLSIRPRPRP